MRESLIYISNAMDVFSTKIARTLIESHTFDCFSENLKGRNVTMNEQYLNLAKEHRHTENWGQEEA